MFGPWPRVIPFMARGVRQGCWGACISQCTVWQCIQFLCVHSSSLRVHINQLRSTKTTCPTPIIISHCSGPKASTHRLKGQCHEISISSFLHRSVYPKPLIIPLETFRIFCKNSQRYSQGAPANRKIFSEKNFHYLIFFWTPWVVDLAYKYILSFIFI